MKLFITILFTIIGLTQNQFAQTLKDEWVTVNTQGCKVLDPYFSEGVTMKWEGPCSNGKANGIGKLTKYKNGEYESTYEGEYKNGIREGKGKFSHISGSILECKFKDGQAIGIGTYDLGDGNHYEGEIVNYRQHGLGTLKMANGSKFDGFFVSDKMYTGKYTNYDGTVSYLQKYYLVEKIESNTTPYKPEMGIRITEYFDQDWNRCKQKEASYYRLITYKSDNQPTGKVKDYYIDGQLQSEFTCSYLDYEDEGKNFREGEAVWYYKNGRLKERRYYYNNKINGTHSFYYENGEQFEESNYDFGELDGDFIQWYQNGKPKLYAVYQSGTLVDSKYVEYDENGVGALVYQENFYKNKDAWSNKDEIYESEINDKNQLSLKINNNVPTGLKNYINLDQNADFSIESIFQKKIGKGMEAYGIIFGFKDWDNYYQFVISDYGSFKIMGKFEGMEINVIDWTKSKAINTKNQRNQIKIFKYNDKFIYSINGEVVEQSASKTLRGNYCGFMAYGKGEYVMEKLIVKEFLSEKELEKKTPKKKSGNNAEWKGNGTGFFINEKGYIATNYHVIEDAKEIQVSFFQKQVKKEFNAKVIISDKQNDLAIIQINDPEFQPLSVIPYVFNPNIRDVGTNVFALGYPIADVMGEEIKFTDGKISSKTGIQGDITVYQISVPIQPGNSGGPLFDNKGNLVGITSSGLNKEFYNADNVNYAIKLSYLKNLIEVMPESISLPNYSEIYNKPLTEKIKILSDFVPIIKVR
jgi:S1-C subfamily serine protease/antitoxin component YwqK of YwqJK toxin-antitoxin module